MSTLRRLMEQVANMPTPRPHTWPISREDYEQATRDWCDATPWGRDADEAIAQEEPLVLCGVRMAHPRKEERI